jgi:hypothetical protein
MKTPKQLFEEWEESHHLSKDDPCKAFLAGYNASRWIRVEDGLPKKGQWVLWMDKYKQCKVAPLEYLGDTPLVDWGVDGRHLISEMAYWQPIDKPEGE